MAHAPPVSTYAYIFTLGTHVAIYGGASLAENTVEKDLWLFDTITYTYVLLLHNILLLTLIYNRWEKMDVAGEQPSARSMGSANRVGNSVHIWGGYCGGVIRPLEDLVRLEICSPTLVKLLDDLKDTVA